MVYADAEWMATLTHHLQMYGADERWMCGYLALITSLVTSLYEANPQPPVVRLLEVEGEPGREGKREREGGSVLDSKVEWKMKGSRKGRME